MLNYDDFCSYVNGFYDNSRKTSDGVEVYPPNFPDLYSLYSKVVTSRTLAVLEFGSGWSTLVFAMALELNRNAYLDTVNGLRHPNKFELMTVDCESRFISLSTQRIPKDFKTRIHPVETKAHMAVVNNQICTLYQNLPAFTADFIYLDGPDCGEDQVLGDINGYSLSFGDDAKSYGLPMAADLIRLEPHLWPGTMIITDGRGANARFLKNNFVRNWDYEYDEILDQHCFSLNEPAWGKYSKLLLEFKAGNLE
jgi:hypothetical protein